jgi:flagellar motor switch protein FliN/FliY
LETVANDEEDIRDPAKIDLLHRQYSRGPMAGYPETFFDQVTAQSTAATAPEFGFNGGDVDRMTEPLPFEFQQFDEAVTVAGVPAEPEKRVEEVVEYELRIELGRTELPNEEVLKLREGSVVALDKRAGDPVDILVDGRLVARGEVLVLNDKFCVRVAEILAAACV